MPGMDAIGGSVWSFSQFSAVQGLTPSGAVRARVAAARRVQIDRQCMAKSNLAGSEALLAAHVAEAIQYRRLDRAI